MERHFEWGGGVKRKRKLEFKNIYRRFVVFELLDTTPPQNFLRKINSLIKLSLCCMSFPFFASSPSFTKIQKIKEKKIKFLPTLQNYLHITPGQIQKHGPQQNKKKKLWWDGEKNNNNSNNYFFANTQKKNLVLKENGKEKIETEHYKLYTNYRRRRIWSSEILAIIFCWCMYVYDQIEKRRENTQEFFLFTLGFFFSFFTMKMYYVRLKESSSWTIWTSVLHWFLYVFLSPSIFAGWRTSRLFL